MLTKKCTNSRCVHTTPQLITEFNRDRYKKDGLRNWCKSCVRTNNSIGMIRAKTPEGKIKKAQYSRKYDHGDKGKATNAKKARKYRNTPAGRKRLKDYDKQYQREYVKSPEGRGKKNSYKAKYRAAKLQATPTCLTEQSFEKIREFYTEAARITKETGISHHVDHMEPLRGKEICGLHVPWNLQILVGPGPEGNCAKGNRRK